MENSEWPVRVIRSRRKTISVRIQGKKLEVRAPLRTSDREIREFLSSHRRWIETHLAKAEEQARLAGDQGCLTPEEIRDLADQALAFIPGRVEYYARRMGVTYGRITIRNQKTRWGSCTSEGNLNFNCLLMLCPPEVIDAVVVHELAHRREMNHSARFYEEVRKVYPDYDKWNGWLKENGGVLLRGMTPL